MRSQVWKPILILILIPLGNTNTKAVLEAVGITQICVVYRQSRGQHAKLGTWPVQNFVQRQSTKL